MREKQVLKKVERALEQLRKGNLKETVNTLLELKHRLREEIESKSSKKDYSDKLRHLMGWYLRLWNDKPPETLRFMQPHAIIAKHLKELIAIYEQNEEDIETLKRDYENFKNTWKSGDRGIMHFRSALPQLKQKDKGFYMSPESKRGVDYYLNQLKDNKEEVWDEDDELPW